MSLYYKETNYTVSFTLPLQKSFWKMNLGEFLPNKSGNHASINK